MKRKDVFSGIRKSRDFGTQVPQKGSPNGWIRERLRVLDKTVAGLAAEMSLPQSRISEIIAGKRAVAVAEVPALASYLVLAIEHALALLNRDEILPKELRQTFVRGYVENGAWRAKADLVPAQPVQSLLRPDPRFPGAEQVIFESRSSLAQTLTPICRGSHLLCIGLDEWTLNLHPEMYVICERRKGDLFELSLHKMANCLGNNAIAPMPVALVIGAYFPTPV